VAELGRPGAAGGLNDPDGLAGAAGGAAKAAIESTGGPAKAAAESTGGAGLAANSAGVAVEAAGAAGEVVPSGSARLSRIFGTGRVSVTGRRPSEEEMKAAFWPEPGSVDPVIASEVVISCCED